MNFRRAHLRRPSPGDPTLKRPPPPPEMASLSQKRVAAMAMLKLLQELNLDEKITDNVLQYGAARIATLAQNVTPTAALASRPTVAIAASIVPVAIAPIAVELEDMCRFDLIKMVKARNISGVRQFKKPELAAAIRAFDAAAAADDDEAANEAAASEASKAAEIAEAEASEADLVAEVD